MSVDSYINRVYHTAMEECGDCGLDTARAHATDADCMEALVKERAGYRMALASIVSMCEVDLANAETLSRIHMFATCGLTPPKGPEGLFK